MMKRIKAGDPVAMSKMGIKGYHEGDYDTAYEYWTKASQLGDPEAHHLLGYMYWKGKGVEKDEVKKVHHWEKAAIGGHPTARYNLGCYEGNNGNSERSVKHFIITANLGHEKSMKALWKHYSAGNITKEELDATLRTHHAAINEMKSSQREAAEKVWLWARAVQKGRFV
jgi:TPR repeat protein